VIEARGGVALVGRAAELAWISSIVLDPIDWYWMDRCCLVWCLVACAVWYLLCSVLIVLPPGVSFGLLVPLGCSVFSIETWRSAR